MEMESNVLRLIAGMSREELVRAVCSIRGGKINGEVCVEKLLHIPFPEKLNTKEILMLVKVPVSWVEKMDALVSAGRYNNRRDFIRAAVERLVQRMLDEGVAIARSEERGWEVKTSIGVKISAAYLGFVELLILKGVYKSIAHFIRTAIEELLKEELSK